MSIPLNISAQFEIMGLINYINSLLLQILTLFLKDSMTVLVISSSFVNQDLQMYTLRKSYCFFTSCDKLINGHHLHNLYRSESHKSLNDSQWC